MKTIPELKAEWQRLAALASDLSKQAMVARSEASEAERKYAKAHQAECKHPSYFIRHDSYQDEKMRAPAEWREKVCSVCLKVLATTSTKEVWNADVQGVEVRDPRWGARNDDDER